MAQRQDCPSNTAREVEQAMWWLDEFANRLRESFTETPDRPA